MDHKQAETLVESGHLDEDAYILHGLEEAIVGYDNHGFLIYSYEKMLQCLDMDEECAVEHIDYNVLGLAPQNFTILYDIL